MRDREFFTGAALLSPRPNECSRPNAQKISSNFPPFSIFGPLGRSGPRVSLSQPLDLHWAFPEARGLPQPMLSSLGAESPVSTGSPHVSASHERAKLEQGDGLLAKCSCGWRSARKGDDGVGAIHQIALVHELKCAARHEYYRSDGFNEHLQCMRLIDVRRFLLDRVGSRFSLAQRLKTFMKMTGAPPLALPLGSPPYRIVRSSLGCR